MEDIQGAATQVQRLEQDLRRVNEKYIKSLEEEVRRLRSENSLLRQQQSTGNLVQTGSSGNVDLPRLALSSIRQGGAHTILIVNNMNVDTTKTGVSVSNKMAADVSNQMEANLLTNMAGAFQGNNNASSKFGDVSRQNGVMANADVAGALQGNNNASSVPGDVSRQNGKTAY